MTKPVLNVKTITKLTDAASALFGLLYEQERAANSAAKERLRRTLFDADVFRHTTIHEEPELWPCERLR
jgi:hypothetical protein